METKRIDAKEIEGLRPTAEGYKAIKWDGCTNHNFHYGEPGEDLMGKVFRYDGKIKACESGLHFCKNPADVFYFYEPRTYNRYFKVKAYGDVADHEGTKSV